MKVLRPEGTAEAAGLIARPGHVAVGGGTLLQLQWAAGEPKPEALVDLSGVGLVGISEDGGLRIGAATRLSDIETSAEVGAAAPLLARAVRDVGAAGIRRMGSLGGQLGWGAGCLLPALLALDATVTFATASEETETPLADWLAAPRGLVLAVTLPRQPGSARWLWRKVGLRAAFTPSVIAVAGVFGDTVALAAGGGPVRPQRLPASERVAREGGDLIAAVEAELDAPDCAFRSARYRRRSAARLFAAAAGGVTAAPTMPVPEAPPEGLRRLSRGPGVEGWHSRPDIAGKIAGRAGYLTDARHAHMLVGRILRAHRPHARILSIDTSKAEAMPGVAAVVTHRDIPGLNAFGIVFQDQPALCDTVVRYEGDAVAAVAARDAETAEAALAAIVIEYEDLPPSPTRAPRSAPTRRSSKRAATSPRPSTSRGARPTRR